MEQGYGEQEWRYALFLRYGIKQLDLPSHCNGCGSALSIFRSLDCKKGGVTTAPHNKLRDGVFNLAGKVFTPALVRDDPKILTRPAVRGGGK